MKNRILLALSASSLAFVSQSAIAAPDSSSATASSSSSIIQPLTIGKDIDLAFGRIVKPSSGTGTVAIGNGADTVVVANGAVALAGVSTSRAKFTINGEGGQAVSINVPGSVDMTNSNGDVITVTLNPSLSATEQLSNAIGGAGAATLHVGGDFALAASTATGVYNGTFTVNVNYQ